MPLTFKPFVLRVFVSLWFSVSVAAAAEGPRANRLALEKSPYLLQHASDLVDWHTWGPEAFAEAERKDKPIFLSIGFSTCLWCEVMRKESFQNPAIAALLNERFVPVLVDREERPDVDRAYMSAAEAAGWSRGWPLNLWLTPERKPFFGGAYFPPEARGGLTGLKEMLERVSELWRTRREDAVRDAEDVARALARPAAAAASEAAAYRELRRTYDREHGGFGPPPKFPQPERLSFLLGYAARTGKKEAREMAEATLRAMAAGEIRDRDGGGFRRYAATSSWGSPHREKMLCDNARLATAYLEAFRAAGDPKFALIARETLDYLLRVLARPGGGFHAAENDEQAFLDDKILAGWNGMAITALAEGARVLKEPRYLDAARETARFLRENLYDAEANRLYRRWRDGERKVPGLAEDYAFVIAGLLDLHAAGGDPSALAWAVRLAEAPPSKPDAGLAVAEDADAAAVAASNRRRLKRKAARSASGRR